MTTSHTGHVLSEALDTLAKRPLNQADSDALRKVATEFWYSKNELANEFDSFLEKPHSDVELRRAGYMLERLTRFTCVSSDRLSEALTSLKKLSARLNSTSSALKVTKGRRVDALAVRWGLDEGLGLKVQELLPYQTRHYEATQHQVVA